MNAAPDDSAAPRTIPEATFSGDTGEAPAEVAAALAAYGAGQMEYAEALGVLQDARLLVPVVAVLGEVEYDAAGLAHDKTSDMATVLLTGRDGRTALLAFTGTRQLQAWNPEARPVPVAAQARGAVGDPGRRRRAGGRRRGPDHVRDLGRRPDRAGGRLAAGPGRPPQCLDSAAGGMIR